MRCDFERMNLALNGETSFVVERLDQNRFGGNLREYDPDGINSDHFAPTPGNLASHPVVQAQSLAANDGEMLRELERLIREGFG